MYKYRIVEDNVLGYEAQYKGRFWLFWKPVFGANTSYTKEQAEADIEQHKKECDFEKKHGKP